MHLTEKESLTSGEPNQMNQAAKPLHTHTHTHTHTHNGATAEDGLINGQEKRTGQQRLDSTFGSTSSDGTEPRWMEDARRFREYQEQGIQWFKKYNGREQLEIWLYCCGRIF